MAKRGYQVDLFEKREDIRTMEVVKGRSINLALSVRGQEALKGVGLEEMVTDKGIPMHARMIHDLDGSMHSIPYGQKHQYIMSVDRRKLNEVLLTAAEKYPNVSFYFEHKLVSCDFKTGTIEFAKKDGSPAKFVVDLVIGSDGAFSAVRKQMMKDSLLNYQQEYIPHGYIELTIPPDSNGEFAMPTNYLHIWPRNEYMMIALPNTDKSFTLTLFMPFEMFDDIKTEDDLMKFFQDKFPDSIPLIGIKELKTTFMKSKALPLVSMKCSPYHIGGKVVILGDAAHAMVPFYGQGMNCGFEDCIVFNDMLDKHQDNFDVALKAYTEMRTIDAQAVNDLAMYNYVEMRKSVNSKLFLLRKKLDNMLYVLFPNSWVPLYTMMAFVVCLDWISLIYFQTNLSGKGGIFQNQIPSVYPEETVARHEEEKKKGKARKSSVFHTTDTDGSMVGAKIPLGSLVILALQTISVPLFQVLTRSLYVAAASLVVGSFLVLRHTNHQNFVSRLQDLLPWLKDPFTGIFN